MQVAELLRLGIREVTGNSDAVPRKIRKDCPVVGG